VHQDFRELSGCDDELWDEVDSVIPIATELGRRSLVSAELSVELSRETESEIVSTDIVSATDLGEIQTCTVPTIVIIPVDMEDLLALHRQ
jgi:hypothetical protein